MNEPMRLLTDKEIARALEGTQLYGDNNLEDAITRQDRAVAKAQLALDQQHEQARVARILGEMEDDFSALSSYDPELFDSADLIKTVSAVIDRWQNLKKREGIE